MLAHLCWSEDSSIPFKKKPLGQGRLFTAPLGGKLAYPGWETNSRVAADVDGPRINLL